MIRDQRDFWSGIMFAVFGVGFVVFAREYDMGTAQRMGPAFFPTVLGALLALGEWYAFRGADQLGVDYLEQARRAGAAVRTPELAAVRAVIRNEEDDAV